MAPTSVVGWSTFQLAQWSTFRLSFTLVEPFSAIVAVAVYKVHKLTRRIKKTVVNSPGGEAYAQNLGRVGERPSEAVHGLAMDSQNVPEVRPVYPHRPVRELVNGIQMQVFATVPAAYHFAPRTAEIVGQYT